MSPALFGFSMHTITIYYPSLRPATLRLATSVLGLPLQIGAVLLIPAIVFAFMVASKTAAILFLVWCIFVGLMDNVLKPLLLGRGSATPVLVVFLGVIGGFMAMGIIGLFVGAVVLSVGYKLFLAWIHGGVPEAAE
jgi:predicted PurR-regulated permease PerM